MLASKESVSSVLIGPPASGKTMFLLAIQQSMKKDVLFIDATNASGAGIVDKLFSRPNTNIILIDEIEKMNKRDQNMLLNLLETGNIDINKSQKNCRNGIQRNKIICYK
jgi:replication-associated recombination protein RarA